MPPKISVYRSIVIRNHLILEGVLGDFGGAFHDSLL